MPEPLLTQFMQPLLAGRRYDCLDTIRQVLSRGRGPAPRAILCDVIWPAMTQLERLYDDDRINTAVANMATRSRPHRR